MSYILNIDTAVDTGSVCLSYEGKAIGISSNSVQKEHASWLHGAIRDLLDDKKILPDRLDAIAISMGPGSYTGLRVGMSAAKGLCYALQKPLITINTLKMMAAAALEAPTPLLCPMIDARRMEVFTAIFDHDLNEAVPYANMILDEKSFEEVLTAQAVTFFGNGSTKFSDLAKHPNARFSTYEVHAGHMVQLSYRSFQDGHFADLAYAEPFYGKDFYLPSHKPTI